MRGSKRLAIGIAAVGLVGFALAIGWPSRRPIELKLVGMSPSGMMDDDGSEPWLVTLSVSNCSAGVLTVSKEWLNVEAKVANRWVQATNRASVGDLARHETREVLILVPFGADSCRLGIEYLPEPLHLRLIGVAGDLGVWQHSWCRALARRVFPVRWLEPLRSDYVGRSPHWRRMKTEIALPQGSASNATRLGGGLIQRRKARERFASAAAASRRSP
jgi:hypothetical protein